MDPLTASSLLARWFWPHYPADVRAAPFLHRDVDANPGNNPSLPAALAEAAELFAANAAGLLGEALPFTDEGVAVLARGLTRARRDAWMAQSDPASPESHFVQVIVHAAAYLGEVMVRAHGARWEIRRPLWESVIHRRRGGTVSPFHWLLKSLADDAIDDVPLAARWRIHVAMHDLDLEGLAVIAPAKKLPGLKRPTYDLLVKYLHQHLPELRDVGEGFPSPAEFTARSFETLSFERLHGGRVVALHGLIPAEGERPPVVEVSWMSARGFDHADTIPCDPGVAYFARAVSDELIEVTVAWQGKPHTHRLSIRGHA
ncbi:MAG: hypothetical protein Q8S73_20050 [Deltaproteobacteria bacterium]|nr:hypothetical protein [Myxococcales bacterium]MDP3216411.1 hypothetical protein [Deltaproteobacteria bacterium]